MIMINVFADQFLFPYECKLVKNVGVNFHGDWKSLSFLIDDYKKYSYFNKNNVPQNFSSLLKHRLDKL